MKTFHLLSVGLLIWTVTSFGGTKQVIDHQASGSSGTCDVKANVVKKVSLSISDTGVNDLVSASGVDFGTVDADGTAGKLPGVALGDKAQYVGDFVFSADRTGNGNVTLTADRSVAGNFNAVDGILLEDNAGTVQPLNSTGGSVTVLNNRPEGDYTKKLGITVHSADSGALITTLRFTLSAL